MFESTNPIIDQGIANIFHQTIKSLGILLVIKEIHEIVLGGH